MKLFYLYFLKEYDRRTVTINKTNKTTPTSRKTTISNIAPMCLKHWNSTQKNKDFSLRSGRQGMKKSGFRTKEQTQTL